MSAPEPGTGKRFDPRVLAQLGVVLVLVWLIFIGTAYLKAGVFSELAGVEFNVAAFGLLFTAVVLFTGRHRAALACVAVTLVALTWFSLAGGTDLPNWMGLDWLAPRR